MTTNLLAQLETEFRGDTLNSVAAALGETPARTQSAMNGALPALIGGIAKKTSTIDQASSLIDTIRRNKLDSSAFADVSSAIKGPGGITGLMNMGRPIMDSLFGVRSGSIADWVTSLSGISRSSSSSLLSLALPIVLAQIAKRVSSTGLSASNLMSFMGDQRSFLHDAPVGLAALLNADDTSAARHVEAPAMEGARFVGNYQSEPIHRSPVIEPTHAPVVNTYETAPKARNSWLWTLPLLFVIPLLGYFLVHRPEPRQFAVVEIPIVPQPIAPLTPTPTMPEPDKLVGTSGVTAAVPVDLGPYQLHFQTGSPKLTAASAAELRKIADTLKAHPQAHADINGYTDNAGNEAANMKLSQERATATMNRIAAFGIDKSRLTAEGHGEGDPVADNATAKGRQDNRRVEIRVTE